MIHSPPPAPCRLALHLLFPSWSFTYLGWSTDMLCLQPHSVCMLKVLSWPKPQPPTLHSTSGVFRGPIYWWALRTGQGPLIWWIWTTKRMSCSQTWLLQILRSNKLASHRANSCVPPCRPKTRLYQQDIPSTKPPRSALNTTSFHWVLEIDWVKVG